MSPRTREYVLLQPSINHRSMINQPNTRNKSSHSSLSLHLLYRKKKDLFTLRMSRKKSKRDSRGYSTHAKTIHMPSRDASSIAGTSKQKVKVSKAAQDELSCLLDKLRNDLQLGGGNQRGKKEPILFSTKDKKMVNKIIKLNDQLGSLGFNRDQIIKGFVAILSGESGTYFDNNSHSGDTSNELLSLEALLDWFCLHFTTEELPRVLTPAELRNDGGGDETISLLAKQGSSTMEKSTNRLATDPESTSHPTTTVENTERLKPQITTNMEIELLKPSSDKSSNENDKVSVGVDNDPDRKKWILQNYQFENDGEEECPCASVATTTTAIGVNEVPKESKTVEEIRLENIEKQIELDTASLNDDAANYMRSKYEIEDLKKKLKKSQQLAKALRKKIDKRKEMELEQMDQHLHISKDQGSDEDDYNGGMQNFFEKSTPVVKKDNEVKSEGASFSSSTTVISAGIPPGWTGKSPKELLTERCRKRSIPLPTFSKISGPRNGCAVKIKLDPTNGGELIINHEGPFSSFHDAQQYTSTLALYQLEPNLPMHSLLPQPFKDLWKTLIKEQELEKLALEIREKSDRNAQTTELLTSIEKLLEKQRESADKIALQDDLQGSMPPDDWDEESFGSKDEAKTNCTRQRPNKLKSKRRGDMLQQELKKKKNSHRYQAMLKSRKSLPIYDYRLQILEKIKNNSVTVICAETGAGKTTQCPQFILEDALESGEENISIICTQPRRISAMSVAERVSEEMDEDIGAKVGFQVRMESKTSHETKLVFCTTGVVLRRLQDDPNLLGVTHVVVDECHERQWQIDFLLITLRQLLRTTRSDLKVVLMSATLDSDLFCSFFNNAPLLKIPGRTFPVSKYYLEDILEATGHTIDETSRNARRNLKQHTSLPISITDKGGKQHKTSVSILPELESLELSEHYEGYSLSTRRSMEIVDEEIINYDLIEDLLTLLLVKNCPPNSAATSDDIPSTNNLCVKEGAVLIFLPGLGEIRMLHELLKSNPQFKDKERFDLIPMHSSISAKDQKRAFIPSKPGCQKIIISTNICETSVTIPDCVCVIDIGLERLQVQDRKSSTSALVTRWCSKASANQRAGRAGRIQAGICCKLYSSQTATKMKHQTTPELLRVPLEEVCLSILAGKLSNNSMDFLLQAPQPPLEESVGSALQVLQDVGAVMPILGKKSSTAAAQVTPLGLHLAKLPVHVRLGKMLIFGSLFGVLDKVLTVVASVSTKSPFILSVDDGNQANTAHKIFRHSTSDFLTYCNLWDAYTKAAKISSASARRFCSKHFISRSAMIEISETRKHLFQLLSSIGFISQSINSLDKLQSSQHNKYASRDEIINAAICAGLYPNVAHVVKESDSVAVLHKTERLWFNKSSTNYGKLLDSDWVIFQEKFATSKTFISFTSVVDPFILLLFGSSTVKHVEKKVVIDDWIEFDVAAQVAVMFRELKNGLMTVFDMYMESNADDPQFVTIVDDVCSLLSALRKSKS